MAEMLEQMVRRDGPPFRGALGAAGGKNVLEIGIGTWLIGLQLLKR